MQKKRGPKLKNPEEKKVVVNVWVKKKNRMKVELEKEKLEKIYG